MPLAEGTTFAGYRIVRLLGSGGMGEVYLAQHPRLPRRDALKLLPVEWSADPDYRARFNREADLASTLWHPHIVGVHDRGEHDGQLWISMDYVEGQDLGHLLIDRYPAGMPPAEVVAIVKAVASALDYAHKKELLHRDVKPANIMLSDGDIDGERRILLTDFGIARNVDDISGLTTTNMTVGTVAYSAPEQLMGEGIDGRADQYALAATAYHLLTGAQLFPHSNPAVVISRHLNSPPPKISASVPTLAPLDPILAAALAKNPETRFAHCTDFAHALADAAEAGLPSQAAPTAPAPAAGPASRSTNAQPTKPRTVRPRALTTIAAAVALAVVSVVVILTIRLWDAAPPTTGLPTPTTTSATGTGPRPASNATTEAQPPGTASASPPPSTAIAPTPTTSTDLQTPAQRYALPGCTKNGAVAERPDLVKPTCNRQHWIEGLTWTAWGANGAEGTGIEQSANCDPSCATGEIFRNRVQVLFTGGTSAPVGSGCPTTYLFYTQMIVAYPDLAAVPFDLNPDYAVTTRYNGMPAIRYNNLDINCQASPNL